MPIERAASEISNLTIDSTIRAVDPARAQQRVLSNIDNGSGTSSPRIVKDYHVRRSLRQSCCISERSASERVLRSPSSSSGGDSSQRNSDASHSSPTGPRLSILRRSSSSRSCLEEEDSSSPCCVRRRISTMDTLKAIAARTASKCDEDNYSDRPWPKRGYRVDPDECKSLDESSSRELDSGEWPSSSRISSWYDRHIASQAKAHNTKC